MRISDWSSDVCSSDLETVDAQWASGTSAAHPTHHGVLMWGLQRALVPHTDLAGALLEFCCDPDEFANSPDPDTRPTMGERWLYASGVGHSADGRISMRAGQSSGEGQGVSVRLGTCGHIIIQ